MTGDQIRTMFTTIVGDEMDDDQFYIFLNAVKSIIEGYRDWNFNRAFDNSLSVAAGDTYLTAKTLPATFMTPRKAYFHDDRAPLILIPFEERDRYKDTYKRYYIDWLNRTISICGATGAAGKTIDLYFRRSTPAITAASSPVWPSDFHPLLAFETAARWSGTSDIDLEGLALKIETGNDRAGMMLLKSMIAWDAQIKTLEYNDRNLGSIDPTSYPNVVDLPT